MDQAPPEPEPEPKPVPYLKVIDPAQRFKAASSRRRSKSAARGSSLMPHISDRLRRR